MQWRTICLLCPDIGYFLQAAVIIAMCSIYSEISNEDWDHAQREHHESSSSHSQEKDGNVDAVPLPVEAAIFVITMLRLHPKPHPGEFWEIRKIILLDRAKHHEG